MLQEEDIPAILRDWLNERGYMGTYLKINRGARAHHFDNTQPEQWISGIVVWSTPIRGSYDMSNEWRAYWRSIYETL